MSFPASESFLHLRSDVPERLPGETFADAFLRRMRHGFVPKTLGICGFMWLFFVGYFATLRDPVHPVSVMPLTPLDAAVPFTPGALWLYLSLWLYVGIPAGLATGWRPLLRYGGWCAAISGVALLCFYAWPTVVPAGLVPADAARHPGFGLLQGVDAPGNACPSMHVASAAFAGVWVHRIWRGMGAPPALLALNAAWAVLIVWSTLATKQHVALDALGGLALAGLAALAARVASHPRR